MIVECNRDALTDGKQYVVIWLSEGKIWSDTIRYNKEECYFECYNDDADTYVETYGFACDIPVCSLGFPVSAKFFGKSEGE